MRESNFKKWWNKAQWRYPNLKKEDARIIWEDIMDESRKIAENRRTKRGLDRLEHQRAFHKHLQSVG